jgi:hypothetical protein
MGSYADQGEIPNVCLTWYLDEQEITLIKS